MSERLFDGDAESYNPDEDNERLSSQIQRVYDCMSDGVWRTLSEIEDTIHDPPASISAQLRHLRKPRWGSHAVEKRQAHTASGAKIGGLFEYRLIPSEYGLLDGTPIDDGRIHCPMCSGKGRLEPDEAENPQVQVMKRLRAEIVLLRHTLALEIKNLGPLSGRNVLAIGGMPDDIDLPDVVQPILEHFTDIARAEGYEGPASAVCPLIIFADDVREILALDEQEMRIAGWVRR